MHLFTWNIGKRVGMVSRASAYLERIAQHDHVIATLQECTGKLPNLATPTLRVVPIDGKVVILYSDSLELLDYEPDSSGRATIARFRLPHGNEITCVGLHWHSRLSPGGIGDPCERGGAIALFRHHLEEKLDKDIPAVLMGDFNCSAQAHEREMSSKYCLFALGVRHRKTPAMEMTMGREKRAWILVEPTVPARVGTVFVRADQKWETFDHVVFTQNLQVIKAEVLSSLEGESFLTKKGVPRSQHFASDHLPVLCQIHYQ